MAQNKDEALWHGFSNSLTRNWPWGIDGSQAFFVPPVSGLGIPAGPGVPQAATNAGIRNVGDVQLHPKKPVVKLDGASRFKNLSLIPQWTQIDTQGNPQATQTLESGQRDLDKSHNAFTRLTAEALKDFKNDKTRGLVSGSASFGNWASERKPQLQQASQQQQAAEQQVTSALRNVGSEETKRLQNLINGLSRARSQTSDSEYTMQATDVSAKEVKEGAVSNEADSFVPLYSIEGDLNEAVKEWKSKFADSSAGALHASFTSTQTVGPNWVPLGFPETDLSDDQYAFIRATYSENGKEVVETISASETEETIKVDIKAVGTKGFDLSPGKWDIANLSDFPLKSDAPEILRNGFAKVDKVFLGYGISMEIELPASLASKVKNLLSKASDKGGSVSFLGYVVSSDGGEKSNSASTATFAQVKEDSDDTHIRIRAQDNNYPVALALHAEKLPAKVV